MNKILTLFKNKTIVILAAVMVANIAVIGYLVYQNYVVDKPVLAIDFKALTEKEIKEWYDTAFESNEGLDIEFKYDESIEEGKVISQSVKVDEEIDGESGIKIVISNGRDPEKEIKLPNFVEEKYTKEKIEKFFSDNHFTDVNYEYEASEEPKDQVIRVNVKDKAKRNQLILITLSAGENEEEIEIEVPNFKDYSVKNARAWGNSNSVTIRINYVFSNDFSEGKIISQSIQAGLTVNPGQLITLQVSQGKGIKVKDLVSENKDDAVKWINANGLKHNIVYDYHDNVENGIVFATDPKAGSMVAEGKTITLHVSKGKDPDKIEIKVDSKAGVSESDFIAYIKGLGLTCSKSGSNYSDSIAKGLIISNDTGYFKKTNAVGYVVSLGKYTLNTADFENKKLSDAKNLVSRENALNAGISLNITGEYSDTVAKDVLFGCSTSGKTMSCKVSKGSLLTVKDFIGQTKTSSFNEGGIQYNVVVDDFYTEGSTYGQVYEQDHNCGDRIEPGIVVTLKIRKGEETKGYIEFNPDLYNGSTIEETKANVQRILGGFNLNISYAKHPSYSIGSIISITVNGGQITTPGEYPLSTKIDVVICDGRLEN